jgi:LysM repeat protein
MDRVGGHKYNLQDPHYRSPAPLLLILALLLGGLFVVSMARAEENPCGEFYITAPGDNLSQIAIECDTSVPALLAANPDINPEDPFLPGQTLRIPINDIILDTGSPVLTYTVVPGDTLSGIAARYGTSVSSLVQANPQIVDPDLIYPGQVLTIPGSSIPSPFDPVIPDTGTGERTYTVRRGDTLSTVAARYGSTVSAITQRNPQITNPDLIYPGQVIIVPDPVPPPVIDPGIIPDTGPGESLYTVRRGDTLSEIAFRHGIPTTNLIQRNSQISNPDLIYPGDIIIIPGTVPLPTPTPDPPQPPSPTIVFPTPAPTPTLAFPTPDLDIIPETGEIFYQEDFSIPGDWFTANQDDFQMDYAEDGYRILNRRPNTLVSSVLAIDLIDAHLETSATRVGGPQTGYYGLVCRWQDVSNYYAFVIGSDGFYGIARVLGGQLAFLGEGRTTSGPIHLGMATNLIGGNCSGSTLTLFINNQSLLQVQDFSFNSGNTGLVVATRDASGTHVQFENFTIRR